MNKVLSEIAFAMDVFAPDGQPPSPPRNVETIARETPINPELKPLVTLGVNDSGAYGIDMTARRGYELVPEHHTRYDL